MLTLTTLHSVYHVFVLLCLVPLGGPHSHFSLADAFLGWQLAVVNFLWDATRYTCLLLNPSRVTGFALVLPLQKLLLVSYCPLRHTWPTFSFLNVTVAFFSWSKGRLTSSHNRWWAYNSELLWKLKPPIALGCLITANFRTLRVFPLRVLASSCLPRQKVQEFTWIA